MMGELSAARQALESARGCARVQEHVERSEEPGTPSAHSQGATSSRVDDCYACPFDLANTTFCRNLRSARRGAARGPSGMTCEHLQPLLESGTPGCCARSRTFLRGVISHPEHWKSSDWVVSQR